MNTPRNAAQRLKEEVANAGAPRHDDQVPPLEENANADQALANPPPKTGVDMGRFLLKWPKPLLLKHKPRWFKPKPKL